tara:strand:+ start:12974 stop:15352 length:2379 start_codon:yes stop_codon:yes gene_type:complete
MADTSEHSDMGFDFGIQPTVDMNKLFDDRVRLRTQAHMSKLATVLSGQMEGKGRTVKKVSVYTGAGCSTDGENIQLDFPITGFVKSGVENMIVTEAILAHEAAGHLRYTNFNAWKRMIDGIKRGVEDKLMQDFVNIVEDARVNYLLGKDFAGSKKRLDYTQRKMMEATRSMLEGKVITDEDTKLPQYGVIAIATEVIISVPHFVNNQIVIDMMDEMRPLFADAIASQDTSRVVKKCRGLIEVYRKYFPVGGDGAPSMPEGAGVFADDMSMDKIVEASKKQKENKNEAQKVRTNRFKDLEMPKEGRDFDDADCEGPEGAGSGEEGEDYSEDGEGGEGGDGGESDGDGGSDAIGEETDSTGEGDSGSLEGDESDSDCAGGSDPADGMEGSEGEGEGQNKANGEVKGDSHDGEERTISEPETKEGVGRNGTGNSNALTGLGTADVNLETEVDELLDELSEMSDWEVAKMQDVAEGMVEEVTEFGEGQCDNEHTILVRREFVHEERFINGLGKYTDRYNQVKRLNRGGIKRIEKVMRNLVKGADTKFNTHKKRGKLDTKRLWAAGSRASDKVFKTDKIVQDFNAAVIVLIDASGSMGAGVSSTYGQGSRASAAGEAAVTISESLEALGVDYEVVDFMSSYGRSTYGGLKTPAGLLGATGITMRKAVHDSLTNEVKARIVAPNIGGENSDGYALEWAMKRCDMIAKEGQKKIVFVISDGQPAGPAPSGMSARNHLKSVLKGAEKEDYILFSVGIAGMDTSRYYGKHGHASVTNTANLGIEIVGPLKECLKGAIKNKR